MPLPIDRIEPRIARCLASDAEGVVTEAMADQIRRCAIRLRNAIGDQRVSFEERLTLLGELAERLLARDGGLARVLDQPGAAFLAEFLQSSNLRRLVASEIPDVAMLSRFVTRGEHQAVRLVPRGLVCHWLAGNVPLLGVLSWSISVLAGNANLIRLSSQQGDFITPLLEALESFGPSGAALASETVVVRFNRGDVVAHRAMSELADVRLAWGGRESVEVVRSLPCRWDCEDVILGPRASFAVVDPAMMSPGTTRRLVTDILYFDQQACSSPQLVFVRCREDGQEFRNFVEALADSIRRQSDVLPRRPIDHGETYRIALDRTRVLMAGGDLHRDDGTAWTLAILDEPLEAVRCANRFVQVVPFAAIADVARHIPANAQTIVTRLSVADFELLTNAAARRGACRFPAPGEAHRFGTPWDGIPLVARLTRWVTRTIPASESGDICRTDGPSRSMMGTFIREN